MFVSDLTFTMQICQVDLSNFAKGDTVRFAAHILDDLMNNLKMVSKLLKALGQTSQKVLDKNSSTLFYLQ